MDLHAPFLHEFYYQAMANDLLDIEDGRRYRCVASLPYPVQSVRGEERSF